MEWVIAVLPPLACGFVIGFLICYTGVGGGALVIPALVLLFGLPPSAAVGTASVYATATKIAAGAEHWRIGNINGRLCALFVAAAAPGVLLTALAINYFSQQAEWEEALQTFLRYLIVAVIALALLLAQIKPTARRAGKTFLLLTAVTVGVLMGATGIGGGVLIAPALLLLSEESPKRVVGASIIIALALSALTALVYAGGGQVDYALAAWMTLGSLLAIIPAGKLLRKSSQHMVRKSLNGLIAVALLLMLWSGGSQ